MPFKKVDCVAEMEEIVRSDKVIAKYAEEFDKKYEDAKLKKEKI